MKPNVRLPCPRRLTPADLPALIELHRGVSTGLPAGFVRARSETELAAYLDDTLGVAYGIDDGDGDRTALSAMSLLRLPGRQQPLAGPPFPLVPRQDWPGHACFLEHTLVQRTARGRGYQRALLDTRLAHAASAGVRWVCAGVQLHNRVSWANLLAKGMAIAGIRFDMGYPVLGLLRPLHAPAFTTDADDPIPVAAHIAAQHQAALQDGYLGTHLASDGSVIYQRLRSS